MVRVRSPRPLALAAAGALTLSVMTALPGSAIDPPAPDGWTATTVQLDGAVQHAATSASGAIAQSDEELLARTDADVVPVMVKLDLDAVSSYAGGVDGLAATSPQVTGKALADNEAAVERYLEHATGVTAEAADAIADAVPEAKVTGSYEIAYGGLSAQVPANQAKALLKVPGVVAVQADEAREVLTDTTPEFIGATAVWPSLGGSRTAGEGVIVGIIDSGIWPEHPSFADPGIDAPAGSFDCQFGDGSNPALGDPFECNDKLIGAYSFLQTNVAQTGDLQGDYCGGTPIVCSPRDDSGHGTHTASTAAGSPVEHAEVLGVDRGAISGIAPGAHIIAYRVCRPGCYQSDSVNAVQQAITDGVDVINFSISGGTNPYTDPVELAFLDATAAGVSVNASAGNSGPAASTVDHNGPWVTTVGASTSNRHFQSDLVLTAAGGATFKKVGSTVTAGVTNAPTIHASSIAGYDARCLVPLPAGSVAGKVVVCDRGTNGRAEKGYNVLQGGAAGMILINLNTEGTQTDNHWLPTIHLEGPNQEIKDFLAANPNVTATWGPGEPREVRGDVMAGFSSRGPRGPVLKPDVTAPGVQILAGHTPTPTEISSGPPGELYQAIAGTSMAAPHAAGASALLVAANPDWTPSEIKSALMMTSVQDVLKEDGATAADPLDRGAGSIRVDRANKPSFVMNVPSDDFYSAAAGSLQSVDLNLPSIYVDPLPGVITVERTIRNVSGKAIPVRLESTADDGVEISVSPKNPNLRAGQSLTLSITIDTSKAEPGWHFGEIQLTPRNGHPGAVIPVAVNSADAQLAVDHTCEPSQITTRGAAECSATITNNAPFDAPISATMTADRKVTISDVSAPATATRDGWVLETTLGGASAPTMDSITPGGSPAGFLPLASFGIAPIAGMGDESIANFNIPEFQFGSEAYSRIGVTSNGYLIVGGGAAGDVLYEPPAGMPNAAAPNNILAPLWTDLNPAAGGQVRVGSLSDGINDWIVVEWASVPAYGTNQVNSFQAWIGVNSVEDNTFAYGNLQGAPADYNVFMGAENRDGSSAAEVPVASITAAANTDWTVNTSPPSPGESVTIEYTASARIAGTYPLRVDVSSPALRTTVSKITELKVVR